MLARLDGPAGVRTLLAQADLAAVLHRQGTCLAAHATLRDAVVVWRTRYGGHDPAATKLAVRLALMYRDCGEPARAVQLFREASDAAPARAKNTVGGWARRPANPDHRRVCSYARAANAPR
jgi:hypothetical protein